MGLFGYINLVATLICRCAKAFAIALPDWEPADGPVTPVGTVAQELYHIMTLSVDILNPPQ